MDNLDNISSNSDSNEIDHNITLPSTMEQIVLDADETTNASFP
jgi:hypothetical protein